jgi:hypothetical protein
MSMSAARAATAPPKPDQRCLPVLGYGYGKERTMIPPLLLDLLAVDLSAKRQREAERTRQVHLAAGRCGRSPLLARLGVILEEAGARLQHVAAPCDPPRRVPRVAALPVPTLAGVHVAFGAEGVER